MFAETQADAVWRGFFAEAKRLAEISRQRRQEVLAGLPTYHQIEALRADA